MNMISGTWLDVGAADDVPVRGARVVKSPMGDIAVFKAADGTLFALRDKCPHKGGPLSRASCMAMPSPARCTTG